MIALLSAALAMVALASCGGHHGGGSSADINAVTELSSYSFKDACSGARVAEAAAYDRSAATHKAIYFFGVGDGEPMDQSFLALPRDWAPPAGAHGDALRVVDLVVCAKRTAAKQVKVCDGFQDHGRTTHNQVRWHTATYQLSLREARTGREVAARSVEATDTGCPIAVLFSNDTETTDDYAQPTNAQVTDFVRPFMTRN